MKKFFAKLSAENSVRAASIVLIVTLAISNILGLLRDRYLTKNIATSDLDVYYAAFRIPDLIFNILILGAITSAFIPVFSDFIAKKKEKEGFRVANILVNISLLFMAVSAVILFFAMPYLMKLIVPSFDAVRMADTVKYSRILMLTPIFFSLSYITGGILNCYKRFLAYSLAPLFYNLAIIIGAAVMAPKYGLAGVVYMVVAGSALHLLVQIIPAMKLGYRWAPVISFSDITIKKIIKLMIPRTISMGSSQVMLIVYTALASAMAAGSITAFNLANNIQTVPIVVLGTSFATAIFPTLASKIAEGKDKEFSTYLNKALRAIGFLLIPSTIIIFLLRAHIVRLILGSGKFSWDDTTMTALTLGAFALSILAQGLIPLLSRAFYALKDTKTPMFISIATVIVSIVIALPLSRATIVIGDERVALSVAGLALAFSIGSFFNVGALIYYLRKQYKGLLDHDLLVSYVKITMISLLMGVVIRQSNQIFADYFDMTRFWGIFSQASVSLLLGLMVFFILGYLFDIKEMKWALTRRINDQK
jgi:putative peptidoglycan lipid II flippase